MGYTVLNNAKSTLATALMIGDTSAAVQAGHGALFAVGSNYSYLVLEDDAGHREVVKITNRASDALTIVRAQDGTTERDWNIGDIIECRPCRAAFNDMVTENATHAATSKSTPAAGDEFPLIDSAASYALKKISWSALLSVLGTTLAFSHASAGAAGTMLEKTQQIIAITDAPYSASTANSEADNATAVMAAYADLPAAGGTLWVPPGNYPLADASVLFNTADQTVILAGAGATASMFTTTGSGVLVDFDFPNSTTSYAAVRDLGINGPGGATPAGTSLRFGGVINHGDISGVHFNGIDVGLKLEDVYHVVIQHCKWKNYITGVTGTTGCAANNNTFIACNWSDGKAVSPAVAKPIDSNCMGYNVYLNCNFESRGYILTVDLRGGSGYDQLYGCRFEQLNDGDGDWIILGNNQKLIGCTVWASATYNCVGTSYYLLKIGETAYGKGNRVDGLTINSATASNALSLEVGAYNNYIRFEALPYDDAVTAVYGVMRDLSLGDNVVEWPGGGCMSETVAGISDAWGGGVVTQYCCDTFEWSDWTFDGLDNTDNSTSGAAAKIVGPRGYGNSRWFKNPTGNKKAYKSLAATSGYTYILSLYALPYADGETIDISIGTSLASPTWHTITLSSTTKWERPFMAYKATATGTIYFQVRANGASGAFFSDPQLEEHKLAKGRFGPAGFVPSRTTAAVQAYAYQENPKRFDKRDMVGLAIPTVGRYTRGDRMRLLDAGVGDYPAARVISSGPAGTAVWAYEAPLEAVV